MKTINTIIITLFISFFVNAQKNDSKNTINDVDNNFFSTTYLNKSKTLELRGTLELNTTQSLYKNWNKGGQTSFSIYLFADLNTFYRQNNWLWDAGILSDIGGFIEEKGNFQVQNDFFTINTRGGYKVAKDIYLGGTVDYTTQFTNTWAEDDDKNLYRTSAFNSFGYLRSGLGAIYSKNNDFVVGFYPIGTRTTFISNTIYQYFGDGETYNADDFYNSSEYELQGVPAGKKSDTDYIGFANVYWYVPFNKNKMNLTQRLDLMSNYTHNPKNIDFSYRADLNYYINKFFTVGLTLGIAYDDDAINRLQLQQILQLGIVKKF
jgi:hypothetical protein